MPTMAVSLANLYSPSTWRNCLHLSPRITTRTPPRFHNLLAIQPLGFHSSPHRLPFGSQFGFPGLKLGIRVRAENGGVVGGETRRSTEEDEEKELEELRGESTMPDRFRYLAKEAPSPPLRWPWFLALGFLIYAWRSVLWEFSNWRKVVTGIFQFVGYLLKLLLALIFHFIGDPISYTILFVETTLHSIRSFYSSIVSSAPIPELTTIIVLASTVLAIGETASPNSVSDQPYLLAAAGVVGYGAVRGVIFEPVFWLMLFGLFSFARLIKKRDYVTSALPVATVLASVGEPWVRVLAIISFTTLAIQQHSQKVLEKREEVEVAVKNGNAPLPLLAVALAIGIRLAAKWAGYRHLTWMIV